MILQTLAAQQSDFLGMLSTLLTPRALQTLRCASKQFHQSITPEDRRKCVEAAVDRYTRATLFFTSNPYDGPRNGLRLHSRYGEHTADFFVWPDVNRAGHNLSLRLGKLLFDGFIDGEMFNSNGERHHFNEHFFYILSDKAITKDERVKGVWISGVTVIPNRHDPTRYEAVTMRINVDMGESMGGVFHADHRFTVPFYRLNTDFE